MKLTVLVDNNTIIDDYYFGEPGLSYYIEDAGEKILFDTGYSDIFLKNAQKMGIDVCGVDTVVFSHGHNDHTGGFKYFAQAADINNTKVVAHPMCFNRKVDILPDLVDDISAPFPREKMEKVCDLRMTAKPVKISKNLTFLGEIEQRVDFEKRQTIGKYYDGPADCAEYRKQVYWHDDKLLDDTALVYESENGLFIITGCSHSGICNIIEQAKDVCADNRIAGIIGGFHLFDVNERLEKTIDFFEQNNIEQLYPCHCVSFQAKAAINNKIRIGEVGVGFTLQI